MLSCRGYNLPDVFEEMARVNREVNRLFGRGAGFSEGFPAAYPPLNLYDDGESFVVRAEVPGLDPASLDVQAMANSLTIKGERKAPQKKEVESTHRRERDFGKFSRSLSLPQPINPDKVLASYKLGVLEVILPKADEAKPRRVNIA